MAKRGRPEKDDEPLLREMARIELSEGITNATELARRVAHQAEGASLESTIKRLATKYRSRRQELLGAVGEDDDFLSGMTAHERQQFARFLVTLESDEERAQAIADHLAYHRKVQGIPNRVMVLLSKKRVAWAIDDLVFVQRIARQYANLELGRSLRKFYDFVEKEDESTEK